MQQPTMTSSDFVFLNHQKRVFWVVIYFLPSLIEELSIPPATFVSQMNYAVAPVRNIMGWLRVLKQKNKGGRVFYVAGRI